MPVVASAPQITIAICTYDRYDVLPKAIASATNQTLAAPDFEILVIDNSPDRDRSANFGRRFRKTPNLTYIIEDKPGLSNARNVAAQRSKAPLIAFMDDDAVAAPDWLEEIRRAFDDFGPAATIVGGRVDPLWGSPRPPWLHEAMLGHLSIVNWGGEAREAAPSEWFAGTNISFRTEAIRAHGGFSANLGRSGSGASLLSNEESQLLKRVRDDGGRLIYAPRAKVDHLVDPQRLHRNWFRKRFAWQAVSDFIMDPDFRPADAGHKWGELLRYFNALPPHERTIRGLLYDADDPELFRWQAGAIYTLTLLSLAGFEGVSLD